MSVFDGYFDNIFCTYCNYDGCPFCADYRREHFEKWLETIYLKPKPKEPARTFYEVDPTGWPSENLLVIQRSQSGTGLRLCRHPFRRPYRGGRRGTSPVATADNLYHGSYYE